MKQFSMSYQQKIRNIEKYPYVTFEISCFVCLIFNKTLRFNFTNLIIT